MKKLFVIYFLFHSLSSAQELRGIWLSRNELGTKAQIAAIMDSLAANNFNTVLINCWSRGYPLFPSETFFKHTGMTIDPVYEGRDVLAEAIAEGHRRGLSVEAWFEYGLVGGYNGYYPGTSGKGKIFDVHPEWVAKKLDGTEVNSVGHYWMAPSRPEVRQFLLELHREVAEKYDIDGIEFDRIRYSGNGYGYDSYTDSLWRASHGGNPPPSSGADPEWMRFRADFLNDFMRAAYDSIKAVNPHVFVTNAPGFYSSSSYQSYNDNLQDWFQWVETGSVDHVQVQMYVGTDAALNAYLNYIFTNNIRPITKVDRIFPALAFAPNGNQTSTAELMKMINTTRTRGMYGNVWWYYGDLNSTYSRFLTSTAYPGKAEIPGRISNWRPPGVIVNESDPSVTKSDGWINVAVKGFEGNSIAADSSGDKWIEYTLPVPADGWYTVYAFVPWNSIRSQRAPYDLFDSSGTAIRVRIDQSTNKNNGWVKIGDSFLTQGNQKVLRISNDSVGQYRSVAADAVMLTINRKLSPNVVVTEVQRENFISARPDNFWLGQNYPNPFNPATTILFSVPNTAGRGDAISLRIYDVLGRVVTTLVNDVRTAGNYSVNFDASQLSSGIYYYQLRSGSFAKTKKMVLMK
ncbi:MAG: family 10 glycosylhydrolase [Bacteroidota bacterium]